MGPNPLQTKENEGKYGTIHTDNNYFNPCGYIFFCLKRYWSI